MFPPRGDKDSDARGSFSRGISEAPGRAEEVRMGRKGKKKIQVCPEQALSVGTGAPSYRTSARACRCASCLMGAKLKHLALMIIHDWLQATSLGGHSLVLLACPVHRLRTVLWLEKAGSEGCRNLRKEAIKVTWKGECLQRGYGWGSKSICCIQGAPTPLPPGSSAWEIIEPGLTANKVLF